MELEIAQAVHQKVTANPSADRVLRERNVGFVVFCLVGMRMSFSKPDLEEKAMRCVSERIRHAVKFPIGTGKKLFFSPFNFFI